jgi:hypothetical protein
MFEFIHNIRKRFSKTYRAKIRREELAKKLYNSGLVWRAPSDILSIIDSLKKLRADARVDSVPFPSLGICHNLTKYTRTDPKVSELNTVKIVCHFAYGWKHHNSNHAYPVPEDVDYTEWAGPNKTLRLHLLDHVIGELEAAYELRHADEKQP